MNRAAGSIVLKIILVSMLTSAVCSFAETGGMNYPMPSEEHLLVIRSMHLRPISLGEIVASPTLIGSNSALNARSNRIDAWNKKFSNGLSQEISVELDTGGAYDAKSDTVLDGVLLENSMTSTSGPELNGRIAVRLVLNKNGVVLFEKEFSAESTWRSPPDNHRTVGEAIAAYTKLYKSISMQLLLDPQFRSALAFQ